MLRATLTADSQDRLPGGEVAMTGSTGRDDAGKSGSGHKPETAIRDDELERRWRELDATLAARGAGDKNGPEGAKQDKPGFGQALKLSSEFIAGVVVGAGLGWLIDQAAGTSPWGLIVFLLLGFGAGVLNVMRSAGMVAEAGIRTQPKDGSGDDLK
jgi:ATP synthase protein I